MTMTARTKSVLVLGSTLLVGLIVGALIAYLVVGNRQARHKAMRTPEGFIRHVECVIEPTDSAQWSALRPILENSSREMNQTYERHRGEFRAEVDSMRSRLRPLLNQEQQQRLDQWIAEFPSSRGAKNEGK